MSAVGKWAAGIISGLIVAVVGALILSSVQSSSGGGSDGGVNGGPPATGDDQTVAIYLNRDSGPAGTKVKISGQGFAASEDVTLRFHTETVGHTTADS